LTLTDLLNFGCKLTMKSFLVIFFLIFSTSAFSNESPFDLGVVQLAEIGVEREDLLFLGRASGRCGSMNKIIYAISSRDAPNQDFSSLRAQSEDLTTAHLFINMKKSTDRGATKEELELIRSRAIAELEGYERIYIQWITDNFNKQGEYWGSSDSFQKEVADCR